MYYAVIHNLDKTTERVKLNTEISNGVVYTRLGEEIDYTKVESIDYFSDEFFVNAGCDGYFVVPHGGENSDSFLCYFSERDDDEFTTKGAIMPIFGAKKGDTAVFGIVTGMRLSYDLCVCVQNNVYFMYQRFNINGKIPDEMIQVEYHTLHGNDANYSGIARKYREYQLERGACIPLRERVKNNNYLKYSAESVYVRIRHSWKPAPSPVEEQTLENEPDIYVACDFASAEKLIKAMKSAGIENAEICSVGWNKSGHDGRWPDSFPIEPLLGGEDGFGSFIDTGKKLGYQMTCHTNQIDAYSIAERWNDDDIWRDDDGNPVKICNYSGGMCYSYNPEKGLEYARQDFAKLRELGLEGLHYIDVISTITPRAGVYNGEYMSVGKAAEWYNKILKCGSETFGGIASEGGFDYVSDILDFALYIAFEAVTPGLCDKKIPLWQLVYHGIILSNPYSLCINPTIKGEDAQLKIIEYGGRPSFYLYSNFYKTNAWMGENDLFCGTDEQIQDSVDAIKRADEVYKPQARLQYEFMQEHKEIADNVFEVTYSDGTTVTVDYNKKEYDIRYGE